MKIKLDFNDVKRIVGIHKARNITYMEMYKKFFMRVMDRQCELDKKEETRWMANISSPITYMLVMAIYGMYQDSKTSFEIYRKIKKSKGEDLSEEEQKKFEKEKEETENLSNNIIDVFEQMYEDCDGSEEFDLSVLDAIILGNGFGGIGYEKSTDTYEVTAAEGAKKTIEEKVNRPNIYRIVPMNFWTEFSARSLQKAKVNLVRKIMTVDQINAAYGVYGKSFAEPADERKNQDIIEYKDWNMVLRYAIFHNIPFVTTKKTLGFGKTYNDNSPYYNAEQMHTDIWTDNSFKIGKDLYEVYEVHTDKTIQVFINGKDHWGLLARLGPWKKKPFYKLAFRDGINGLYDIGVGYLGYGYHKSIDAFLNMRLDNDRLIASSPMVVNADDNFFDGFDHLSQYPGKLIKVKDINESIKPMEFGNLGSGAANTEVELLGKSVQDAVGVSGYKLGIQQKVERSAKGVSELIEAADASMKSFVVSISKAKGFIAKYMVLLAIEYVDSETFKDICGTDDLKQMDISTFVRDYSFEFNVQSVSSLREREELELIKSLMRDYSGVTRPNGTPVMNQDEGFRLVVEKSGAPESLILSEKDSIGFMKEQITANADLKKFEMEQMPAPVEAGGSATAAALAGQPGGQMQPEFPSIVPGLNEGTQITGEAGVPGIQAGQTTPGVTTAPNPLGNNS